MLGTSEFGRFVVIRLLGRGGMGEVVLARDRELGGTVALKRLASATPDDLLRLKREFRSLADLAHPNLVRLYDLVGVDGAWDFTMEPIEGVGFSHDALVAGRHERILGVEAADSTLDLDGPRTEVRLDGPPAPLAERIARLRSTLPGLARGLVALHAVGLTHGDVKPSNVLVEPGGRAVVLDFGLVQPVTVGPDPRVEGTPLYLAPEVLRGEGRRPPSDWYAVGMMVFEALTGGLPDDGTLTTVLNRRLLDHGADLALPPDVPADLARLVRGLLAPDPALRSGAVEVLAWADEVPATPVPEVFVGRAAELGRLARALASPGPRGVLVRGRSGAGKTALLRRFVDEVAVPSGALVLQGVCHDRESLPFNAFDRVIDGLVRALALLSADARASLLPDGVDELAAMFPVLGAVVEPARLDADGPPRRVAFDALRVLLGRLAARRPVAVLLDDVQWADGDSRHLLRALLDPPAPILLVLSVRAGEDDDAIGALVDGDVLFERLDVDRLGLDDARSLADHLGATPSDDELARMVDEADGNAFLVDQALRFGRADGAAVLRERVAALAATDRALLVATAVASEPLRLDAALRAAGVQDAGGTLARLRAARLVRTHGGRASDRIEPYHGRVRDRVVEGLAPAERARVHLALADDLVMHDPAALVALERLASTDEPPCDAASRALPLVHHLRAARDLDPAAVPASHLLPLELAAGLHVRAGHAYDAAVGHLRRAASLIDDETWRGHRALAWRVHLELARSLARAADFPGCLATVDALFPRVDGDEERVALLRLRLAALVATQQMATALDTALDALALLGTRLPRRPRPWHVVGSLVRTKVALRGRRAADLRDLPPMRDRTARAVVAVERAVLTACFVAEPDLFPLLVFDMVRATLRHGHAPESAAAWACFGLVTSGVLGDVVGGAAFGELGLHVVGTLGAEDQRALVEGIRGGFLIHWVAPMTAAIPVLERGWQSGAATGDHEFAGMCASIGAYQRWFAGLPLDEAHRAAAASAEVLPRLGQDRTHADVTRLLQLCAGLRGEDPLSPPWTLKGRWFDVDEVLPRQVAANDRSNVASLRSFLAFLAYVYGDLDGARAHADVAEADMPALVGTVNLVFGTFVAGLARLACAGRPDGDGHRQGLAGGRRARGRLAAWAKKGPAWITPLHDLVLAEELRLKPRSRAEAAARYEAALAGAREQGMLHVEALAAEAAARFHLADDPERARAHWARARDAWSRWGAISRVATMTSAPDAWAVRCLPAWPPG